MAIYAVVENGTVINMVEWDGISDWPLPVSTNAIAATATAMIGGTYASGVFTLPVSATPTSS